MNVKCPRCSLAIDLEQVSLASTTREILRIYTQFGVSGKLASEYMDCFRTPSGQLAERKHLRLLNELLEVMTGGKFRFYGREYHITAPEILRALQTVCNQNVTGLKDHLYLTKVMLGLVERRDAKAEERTEQNRRDPYRREVSPAPRQASADIPPSTEGFVSPSVPSTSSTPPSTSSSLFDRDEQAAREAIARFKEGRPHVKR